jgi:chromosomal replication initiator protein
MSAQGAVKAIDHPGNGVQNPYETLWNSVKATFPKHFGDATFKSWLAPLTFKDFSSGLFVLGAPTSFMKDWVQTNCAAKILDLLKELNPAIFSLEVIIDKNIKIERLSALPGARPEYPSGFVTEADEEIGDIEVIGSRLEPRYVFENFVVGQSNELAHAAALRVAESAQVHFNPLFIYGGVGLGKTHLMHAIAWHIRKCHPTRKVVYLSAEKFMYLFIRALRFKDVVAFKEKFRSVDVLMIDDFQFISGKESTQEEFFHTFNALVDQNHQVIISADKSPSDLTGLEERMRSRLGWGLVADIHPTTYELRLGILQSKIEQMKMEVPRPVLEFLAHKITSNVREMEGALNRIVAHSTLVGRQITLDSTQEVLRDILRAHDRRVSIEEIQRKVSEHYNIKVADMHSARRLRSVARPRQVAMYLSKMLTEASLPEIGRKFGGRDHATVMHAVKKIQELMAAEKAMAEDVDLLKKMLQN